MKKIRIAICMPWYQGPDKDTAPNIMGLQHYFGRLEERSQWLRAYGALPDGVSPLTLGRDAEVDDALIGYEFDFCLSVAQGISLPGAAREIVTEQAINAGADILFSADYDMMVQPKAFMRLLLDCLGLDNVPVVAALAFTGRKPLAPVIYKRDWMPDGRPKFDPVHDYKRDALQRCDAFGTGTFMAKAEVFKKVPQPWFMVNGSVGEDIFFTGVRCHEFGVPVYVDTRAKVDHKPTHPEEWHNEEKYLREYVNGQA